MNTVTGERLAATGLALSLTAGILLGTAQEADAVPSPSVQDIKVLQHDLNGDLTRLGMPNLPENGKAGPQTRRALCAKRLFTGHVASLAAPSIEEIRQLQTQHSLTYAASGLIVSKTCQVLGVSTNNSITNIFPVSTGNTAAGHITPTVNTSIAFARTGWHNSTKYPSESGNGNMLEPLYFESDNSFAIHGSRAMKPSVTTPQSHGCVRTSVSDQYKLWAILNGPSTPVQDKIVKVKQLPIRVLN
ncbi:L,D-transpeptidase [Polaromonas sp.]|nr:L,D-transpeptidase [Candidatus Saccharibacteria bacterium]